MSLRKKYEEDLVEKDPKLQYQMGSYFSKGNLLEKSYERALYWYKQAAENGNIDEQFYLWRRSREESLIRNQELAIKWYTLAAEQGNADAQYALGEYYDYYTYEPLSYAVIHGTKGNSKSTKELAIKWYTLAAEQGYAAAQCRLGHYHYLGEVGNKKLAIKWYRLAAAQGYAAAQCGLGHYYLDLESKESKTLAINGLGHYYRDLESKEFKALAIKWYTLAAEQGYAEAQYFLGEYYFYGEVVEQSYEQAFKWLKLYGTCSGERILLARCYLYGLGTDKNLELAFAIYKQSALYDSEAQNFLGYCYYKGLVVKEDKEEAIRWFGKASDDGNPFAKYNLEKCKQNADVKSEEEIIKFAKKFAPYGNPVAQNILGYCYKEGLGVKRNFEEAIKWYALAAAQGYADAQYNLSLYYYIGDQADEKKFYKWLSLAAMNGNSNAQVKFGYYYLYNCDKGAPSWLDSGDNRYTDDIIDDDRYYHNHVIDNDNEWALSWIKSAALQNSAKAQYAVGNCYFYGYGVKEECNVALKWYKQSALQGSFLAQKFLYKWYEGKEEAVKWLQMAAAQGDMDSQIKLAYCYYNGIGTDRNCKEAVKWYKEAALQDVECYSDYGLEYPRFMLGYCYYCGEGVEQSYEEASKWYKKAEFYLINQQNPEAFRMNLKMLDSNIKS